MYIELLLIIDFLCFTGLLMLYYKTEKQAKALQEMRECNQSLLNVIKLINNDLSEVEDSAFKGMKELERNARIVDDGRIKDYCALRQEIREINKYLDYLHGEKK